MPTYSPDVESSPKMNRTYTRLTNEEMRLRLRKHNIKPWVYLDSIDSVLNNPTQVKLVVADGKSTESIRADLQKHHEISGGYTLQLYTEKLSQWWIFNDIIEKYVTPETKYFVYTSSDVNWRMDWVQEAIKEFEKNPKLQILFPCVSRGDGNLPCQIASAPQDIDLIEPPYQRAARAPVLNGYAMIFRMDFLRAYGGYPTLFRNCFSESFLHYMCEAAGGIMRLMPRGWVWHHSAVDVWKDDGGSTYYYSKEKHIFDEAIEKVLTARADGKMNVEFLKGVLYQ